MQEHRRQATEMVKMREGRKDVYDLCWLSLHVFAL